MAGIVDVVVSIALCVGHWPDALQARVLYSRFELPDTPECILPQTRFEITPTDLDLYKHNKIQPVGFYSRKLMDAEHKYRTLEREGLAIVDSCKHFPNEIGCKTMKTTF